MLPLGYPQSPDLCLLHPGCGARQVEAQPGGLEVPGQKQPFQADLISHVAVETPPIPWGLPQEGWAEGWREGPLECSPYHPLS